MNNEYKGAKFFTNKFSISSQTLRNWGDAGKIQCIRLHGNNGERRYKISDVYRHMGVDIPDNNTNKHIVIYTRVSSTKQKEDLMRQRDELIKCYPRHDKVIADVGSGVNFNRKGLQSLLELVYSGMVNEVVVMHRDRLARIGIEILDGIFKKFGVKLVVHCQSEDDDEGKNDELISIITLFVASHYGKRAASNKRRRAEGEGEKGKRTNEKKTKSS